MPSNCLFHVSQCCGQELILIFRIDFWGPASNFGIPIAAVMDIQKDPEMWDNPFLRSQHPVPFLRQALGVYYLDELSWTNTDKLLTAFPAPWPAPLSSTPQHSCATPLPSGPRTTFCSPAMRSTLLLRPYRDTDTWITGSMSILNTHTTLVMNIKDDANHSRQLGRSRKGSCWKGCVWGSGCRCSIR